MQLNFARKTFRYSSDFLLVKDGPNIQVESNVLTVDEVEIIQRQRVANKKQGNESKRLLGKTIQSLQVKLDEMKSKYKKLDDLYRYTQDRDRKEVQELRNQSIPSIKELNELKSQKYYLNKLTKKQRKQIESLMQHTDHLEDEKIKSIPVMDDEQLRKKAFAWNECTFHYSQHRAFLEILEQAIQERHHAYETADYRRERVKEEYQINEIIQHVILPETNPQKQNWT